MANPCYTQFKSEHNKLVLKLTPHIVINGLTCGTTITIKYMMKMEQFPIYFILCTSQQCQMVYDRIAHLRKKSPSLN